VQFLNLCSDNLIRYITTTEKILVTWDRYVFFPDQSQLERVVKKALKGLILKQKSTLLEKRVLAGAMCAVNEICHNADLDFTGGSSVLQ
jgi:hypothetical protein